MEKTKEWVVKNYKLLSIALALVVLTTVFFWPACSAKGPVAKVPTAEETIDELRTTVVDLTTTIEDLTKLNEDLRGENKALKAMLAHCMEERIKEERD
jgi:ABC-type transport system involved in cytochrome bd biosynthesis fused ATPase/permease subunit